MTIAVDKTEMLRYLGWRGQALDEQTARDIDRAIEECLALAQPKFVWRPFELAPADGGFAVEGTPLVLRGSSMDELLPGAQAVALMAATLGARLESQLSLYSQRDVSYALLLDAAASTAIEAICDEAQREIAAYAKERGLVVRPRFSPGYGDLPLTLQPTLLAAVDAQRRIGLTATPSNLLVPRKSVTAIVALAPTVGIFQYGNAQLGHTQSSCASCPHDGTCDKTSCIRNRASSEET